MKILKWMIGTVVILAVIVAIGVLVANGLVVKKEAASDMAWGAVLVPLDRYPDRFPKTSMNETAFELEAMAAGLGIDLAPSHLKDRPHPTAEARKAFDGFAAEARKYLDQQLSRPENRIDPLPDRVRSFFQAHPQAVNELRSHLSTHPTPRWEVDISRLFNAPLPPLLGPQQLMRLMVLDALEQSRQGQDILGLTAKDVKTVGKRTTPGVSTWAAATALLMDVEAVEKLNASIRERPELISQMITMVNERLLLGLMRKIEGIPNDWQKRLADFDLRQRYLMAIEGEIWAMSQFARVGVSGESTAASLRLLSQMSPVDKEPSLGWFLVAPVLKPYLRYSAVDMSQKTLAIVIELRKQDICAFNPLSVGQKPEMQPARWNLLGQMAMPNFGSSWSKVTRLVLDTELTQKVLLIKQLRRESADGSWPQQIPGIEKSACREAKWIYKVDGSGKMSLSYSKKLGEPAAKPTGLVLPLEYKSKD